MWPPKTNRRTMMFRGRLMRSAMVLISLKAFSMARSELLMVRRFWYFELPNSSKLAAPVPCGRRGRTFSHCRHHCRNLSRFSRQNKELVAIVTLNEGARRLVTATSHLAYHGGEVASVEQRVLGISHSGWVFEGFLVGERPPLWSHVDDSITYKRF